jgi:signal transduction histidine kinase/CheY-like chemotaxis protein/integral membrane sensor domain MASE1
MWCITLFLSYILLGHLLSSLSFQSQVMPIWLPAGIGLIGCYLFWWRFFPFLFLASFAFNFSIDPQFEYAQFFSSYALQNGLIAFGVMLQGIVGASILKYWLGNPFEQSENTKTLYFIIIVGIIVSLISSNIGVYSLSIFNTSYPVYDYQLNVIYWWLGDTLGILLVVPFFLSLFNFKRLKNHQRKTFIIILSSISLLFIITILITQFFISASKTNSLEFVKKEARVIENSIHRNIYRNIDQLKGLANFIQKNPMVTNDDFNHFVKSISQNTIAIKAMSWNPIIHQKHKTIHNEGLVEIHSRDVSIKGDPLAINDPIVYVKIISPEKGNEKAIGFNIYSNASRKETLKSAIKSYQSKATPIIQLVQSAKPEPAFLLFVPVFEKLHSNEETTKHLKGFATAVFLLEKILASAFTEQQKNLFYFEFFEQGAQAPFYANTKNSSALTLHNESDHFTDKFHVAGQQWNINLLANQSYVARQQKADFLILYVLLFVIVIAIITSLLLLKNRQFALDVLVEQRTESLKEAMKEANYANKAKSQFLANMSHEIRTPMNSVVGFSNLAQQSTNIDEIKSYLNNIAISSDLLLHIVNDILDISKIESQKLVLNHDVFDFHLVLTRIYSLFEAEASKKQLNWSLGDNLPEPMFVKGDQARIEQILINLCGNAIKFTAQGSVTLIANLLKKKGDEAYIQLQIKDTGIGVSKEKFSALFTPFTQADASTSRDFGGTGLGLSISKELSLLMNADISVISTPSVGSTFTFSCHLPIATPKLKVPKIKEKYTGNISTLKVLVAEDNRINQKLIDIILKNLGINAIIVENGQLAIDYVKKEYFDVILMDCQMPVLDGYEATKKIRSIPEFKNLPIFALTADVDTRSKEKARALGFDKHFTKPINVVELTESLQKLVK